jgi:steroid 5-alpha-reductase/3-oxo-5-alpha-steroid 4-dehydrogenase 1
MGEAALHGWLTLAVLGLGAVTAASLLFIDAPYGRHNRAGWGPQIPNALGWVIMEAPAVLLFGWIYTRGEARAETAPLVLLAMWQLHYLHRTVIYPLRLRSRGKTMPLVIALLAVVFNSLNAYINARWISHFGGYEASWLGDPRFVIGACLFAAGAAINLHADEVLFRLRRPGETGYSIPRGGLYRWVSCPNYLGEIIEWTGWAIATWSLPGVAFAVYTAANVGPRALAHHRWYRARFPDYPAERKALVPHLL